MERKILRKEFSYQTPIGRLWIAEENGELVKISTYGSVTENYTESYLIKETFKQLSEYFLKKRRGFDLPIKIEGTEFQKRVWQELLKIPYGETRSYGELAQLIGSPKAARAVGGANNKNKILIVVPCHRVVGAKGDLVGFAAGIEMKKYLLELESEKSGNNFKSVI